MRRSILLFVLVFMITSFSFVTIALAADDEREVDESDLAAIGWRAVGPANMGGRATAIALVPESRTSFFVGFATGGLFKTDNLGTTFSEVFRDKETASIGAIAVASASESWPGWDAMAADDDTVAVADRAEQGRGKVVWVGTGEGNGRNSVSWGHGVYRSTDGGASFEHVGLTETHNIPAMAVDSDNPDRLFVAALGHLWGENPERGVFLTTDGGTSWDHVLKVDDEIGACDVLLAPDDPQTVYAALYKARRTPWSFEGVTDRGGIFRSRDGGATWTRLNAGLPERTGRIGLTVCAGQPEVLYAVIESDQGGTGRSAWDDRSPAGGLFRSDDRGDTWRRVNDLNFRPFYFSRVIVDPENAQRVYMPGWHVAVSDDGGVTFRLSSPEVHVDHHAFVIDPADSQRLLLGNDGGLYISHDGAATWDYLNHLDLGQFYHVDVDMSDPYRLGGGLQDNGSWIGPSATGYKAGSKGQYGVQNEDWLAVFGGDGFRVAFDPLDENIIYATSQGGNLGRIHLDSQLVAPLKAAADEGQEQIRWNWDAPFVISHHDPTVLYHAGNKVFKLTERGEYWYAISGDLTRREVDKVMSEGSKAESFGTITALSESPLTVGVIWAGSDDGLMHVTFDDGGAWKNVTPKQVKELYVAHLEASHHDDRTAYCAVDGHRSDVFKPIVLMTENGGVKWKDISGDLPAGSPVRVVREDPGNASVLYCGTENAAYVTLDRGKRWLKLGGKSLPTVPVYDLVVHPREHDLIAGTHGRSLWILDDVACLAEMPAAKDEDLHLFRVRDATPQLFGFRGYGQGNRVFGGANPPAGAVITYWLKDLPEGAVSVAVADTAGTVVRTLPGPSRPGLNRVVWDLQPDEPLRLANARRSGPVFVEPMTYTLTVSVDGHSGKTEVVVEPYPGWQPLQERMKLPPARPGG